MKYECFALTLWILNNCFIINILREFERVGPEIEIRVRLG